MIPKLSAGCFDYYDAEFTQGLIVDYMFDIIIFRVRVYTCTVAGCSISAPSDPFQTGMVPTDSVDTIGYSAIVRVWH